jgi:hypothetical protein
MGDDFARFEHGSWQRVAGKYDSVALEAIRIALENGIKQYARGNEFVLPMAANVILVSKN